MVNLSGLAPDHSYRQGLAAFIGPFLRAAQSCVGRDSLLRAQAGEDPAHGTIPDLGSELVLHSFSHACEIAGLVSWELGWETGART